MTYLRFLCLLLCFAAFSATGFSQSYQTAVGIRAGNGFNITAQQYLVNNWTLEGILHTSFMSDNIGLNLLAEKHRKILIRNLNIYYGAGGHYYWQNGPGNEDGTGIRNNVAGLSLIGGAELSLGRLNLSVDWKPELHLIGQSVRPFDWNGAAISVRYIIDKRERRKVKEWEVWGKLKVRERRGRN
jgi:hypothetical protein